MPTRRTLGVALPLLPPGVQRTPSPQWQGVAVLAGAPREGARGTYPSTTPGEFRTTLQPQAGLSITRTGERSV